jgi:hypothetical protein
MNNEKFAACVWHEIQGRGNSSACADCRQIVEEANRWGMLRSAVNVNRKLLESIWGVSDQQLGEFCHEQRGIEVAA